jgi:hypothetical protein
VVNSTGGGVWQRNGQRVPSVALRGHDCHMSSRRRLLQGIFRPQLTGHGHRADAHARERSTRIRSAPNYFLPPERLPATVVLPTGRISTRPATQEHGRVAAFASLERYLFSLSRRFGRSCGAHPFTYCPPSPIARGGRFRKRWFWAQCGARRGGVQKTRQERVPSRVRETRAARSLGKYLSQG